MISMNPSTPNRYALISWLLWTAGFLAFPIAGVAGGVVAGRVDTPIAAVVAGLITGAVIGTGQWLVSRGRLRPGPWILATALGMGAGLLLGATVVGFGTSLADVAVMGALTGAVLGVAQTVALPAQTRRRWWWAVAMPLLWPLGWIVTTLAGIPVEEQFTIFGASGAVTFSALSGILLQQLLPARQTARPPVTDPTLASPAARHRIEGHGMTTTPQHVIFGTTRRRRHGAGGLRGEAGRRRRDPGALAGPVRGLLEQPGGLAGGARRRRAGCAPATSANGATATLRLIDRARDFLVTSGGKTISPSFIENALRASPYLAEAVVFGHGRKYLTALIEIDFETVADWARDNDVAYTGFTSLAQHPRVRGLIQREIDKANEQLARVEQIKAFRILPKALDPEEEGEPVTPTRKVKRNLMYERFKPLVEEMYDDREEKLLAASAADALA